MYYASNVNTQQTMSRTFSGLSCISSLESKNTDLLEPQNCTYRVGFQLRLALLPSQNDRTYNTQNDLSFSSHFKLLTELTAGSEEPN